MPRGRAAGRRGAQESALQMKAVVICMRLFYRENFEEIERKIGMKAATTRGIWQRAYHLPNSDDLVELLSVLEHKAGAGRPNKVTDDTQESATVRNLLYEKCNKTFKQVAEDHNISLARSTFKRIVDDYRDEALLGAIVRGVKQIKPLFTLDTME